MGMFSAVQGASVNGGGIYFKAGRYKVEILAVKSILSRKNENLFVVETEIKESDCADLRPNTKCSQVINLSKHDSAPGNIKAFVAAALDISPTSEEVNWEELCDAACTDANPLKGTMMTLICANTKTKAGGDFTLHQWSLLSAPSGALPTATAPLATPPAAPRAAAPTPPAAPRPAAPLPPPVAKPWPVGFVAHPNSPGWLWNPQTNEVIAQP